MNKNDHNRILDFYEGAFVIHGDDPQSVHWAGQETQQLRFSKLVKIADLQGKKVLDVGCGLGDLYLFFLRNKIDVAYTGIDIVPAFVERARQKFTDVQFILGSAESIAGDCDYIFASGAFSFSVEHAQEYYFRMIKNLYQHARSGVSFNMLDRQAHCHDDTFVAYDKTEVITFCKTFANSVVLVDDYYPWDFTVYLYKGEIK